MQPGRKLAVENYLKHADTLSDVKVLFYFFLWQITI